MSWLDSLLGARQQEAGFQSQAAGSGSESDQPGPLVNVSQFGFQTASAGIKGGPTAAISTGLLAAAPFAGPAAPFVALAGGIAAIFGGHHAAAVKNEAAALNAAVPGVQRAFIQIFAALDAGSIDWQQANSLIDQTVQGYEQLVYAQYKVKRKAGNGPDVVEKTWIQPWANELKSITRTGGTFTSSQIQPHAGFNGLAPFTITYQPKTLGKISAALGGNEGLIGIAAAGAAVIVATLA